MDPVYWLTAAVTICLAAGGLALICHLERRQLRGRRPKTRAVDIGPLPGSPA